MLLSERLREQIGDKIFALLPHDDDVLGGDLFFDVVVSNGDVLGTEADGFLLRHSNGRLIVHVDGDRLAFEVRQLRKIELAE